jgi:hypothetical protein
MKNILYYTRDGHLDYFALISKELSKIENEVNSFYVCHTKAEEIRLQSEYNVNPWNLGTYIEQKEKENINWYSKLDELQEKYPKIPLKRLVWGEIFEKNMSEDELVFLLIQHFEFWENVLIENDINLVLTEGPGILSTSVLWLICDKLNIHFLEFTPVGISGRKNFRTSWEDGIHNFEDYLKTIIIKTQSEEYLFAEKYFCNMTERPEKPNYVGRELSTGKKIKEGSSYWLFPGFPSFRKIVNYLLNYKNKKTLYNYYLKAGKKERYINWLVTALRTKRLRFFSIFEKSDKLTDEKFFLFPLHILNEWSDYPWMGLKYPNTIELIAKCSACLPLGTKLYVKEHPALFPGKSIRFYKSVKNIRNVKLVGPYEDTFRLINKSQGIITLGGTTGWEAYIMGKPVILLADSWYRFLEGIFRINNDEELASVLQKVDQLILPDKKEKIRVISILYTISFEANHYPQTEMNLPSNIKRLAAAVKKFCEENLNNK